MHIYNQKIFSISHAGGKDQAEDGWIVYTIYLCIYVPSRASLEHLKDLMQDA